MSVQAIAWVLEYSEARGTDRLVMFCLANRVDDDNVSWPSVGRIAHESRTSRRSVQRALQSLVELGEITPVEPGVMSADSRLRYEMLRPDRRPVVYRLNGVSDCRPASTRGVTAVTSRGDNNIAYGVSRVAPESSIEPLENRELRKLAKGEIAAIRDRLRHPERVS